MEWHRTVKLSIVMLLADVLFLGGYIVAQQFAEPLIHPRLAIERGAISCCLIVVVALFLIEMLIVLSVWLFKKKRTAEILIAIVIIVFVILSSILLGLLFDFLAGGNLESRTSRISDFGVLDDGAMGMLKFEKTDYDDLMTFYPYEIKDYYYCYYPYDDEWISIKLHYTVSLTDERYEEIISMLEAEPCFKAVGDSMLGEYIIDSDVTLCEYYSNTRIIYDASNNTIEFVWNYQGGAHFFNRFS